MMLQPVALLFPSPSPSPSLPLFSRSRHLHLSLSSTPSIAPSVQSRRTGQSDASDGATWHEDESDELDSEQRMRRGFGSAMVYDTSLEEKLLNEIQHNRKRPNVNLDKVRVKKETKPVVNLDKVRAKKENFKSEGLRKQTVSTAAISKIDVTPKGIRVRLWNLPKKKNVHRDLQMAFKGFRGILHIDPAVSGNKKTRDPICKGFAFVDLATQEAANRFVEMYSERSILFGKVEKQINCCVINQSSNSAHKFSNNSQKAPILQRQLHQGFMGISVNNSPDEEAPVIFVEEDKEGGTLSKFEIIQVGDDDEEEEWDAEITKLPSGEKEGNGGLKKKKIRPKRKAKTPKLSLPLRLKGKERNVLTGVFSKYGANSGATSTKEG